MQFFVDPFNKTTVDLSLVNDIKISSKEMIIDFKGINFVINKLLNQIIFSLGTAYASNSSSKECKYKPEEFGDGFGRDIQVQVASSILDCVFSSLIETNALEL